MKIINVLKYTVYAIVVVVAIFAAELFPFLVPKV
jgi:hypothetical protein